METQARELVKAGRADEAALVWQRILAIKPAHVEALVQLGTHALSRSADETALALFEQAAAVSQGDPMLPVYIAVASRALGRTQTELEAVTRALTIDPYFLPALLHKGMLLERLGKRRQAARVFRDVLKIMPSQGQGGQGIRKAAEHARDVVAEDRHSLGRHLDGVLADLRRRHSGADLRRFEETVHVMTGAKKRYSPDPVMLHYAQLPPLQFYDRELFPWLDDLELQTETIRRECEGVLAEDRAGFDPYIKYPPGAPLNQWRELNHSDRWTTYPLWRHGSRIDAHCQLCPRTAEIVDALPLARTPGMSPNVLFSALEARTVIPPHTGDTNARLIVHLPLILPSGCTFRVGNDVREWEYGKAWVFDDSVEHEARNDSDELRVQLMFDVWNPYLTDAERELVNGLLAGLRSYYAADD